MYAALEKAGFIDYMQVWENGYSQPGPRGLLVAYTKFSGAREFDRLDDPGGDGRIVVW